MINKVSVLSFLFQLVGYEMSNNSLIASIAIPGGDVDGSGSGDTSLSLPTTTTTATTTPTGNTILLAGEGMLLPSPPHPPHPSGPLCGICDFIYNVFSGTSIFIQQQLTYIPYFRQRAENQLDVSLEALGKLVETSTDKLGHKQFEYQTSYNEYKALRLKYWQKNNKSKKGGDWLPSQKIHGEKLRDDLRRLDQDMQLLQNNLQTLRTAHATYTRAYNNTKDNYDDFTLLRQLAIVGATIDKEKSVRAHAREVLGAKVAGVAMNNVADTLARAKIAEAQGRAIDSKLEDDSIDRGIDTERLGNGIIDQIDNEIDKEQEGVVNHHHTQHQQQQQQQQLAVQHISLPQQQQQQQQQQAQSWLTHQTPSFASLSYSPSAPIPPPYIMDGVDLS